MIKSQSLEATLPAIIFIHDVYISLLEQDHQEEASLRDVRKRFYFAMYKNTATYKKATQLEYEMMYKNVTRYKWRYKNVTEFGMGFWGRQQWRVQGGRYSEQHLFPIKPIATSPLIDAIPPSACPSLTLPSFTMWASPPPPFKPWLLVACTEGWLSVINDTTKTTWVKGCQLSTIQVRSQPEWRFVRHQQYECKNDQCGWWLVWSTTQPLWSKTCVVNDLCGQWLYGRWPVWWTTC